MNKSSSKWDFVIARNNSIWWKSESVIKNNSNVNDGCGVGFCPDDNSSILAAVLHFLPTMSKVIIFLFKLMTTIGGNVVGMSY